MGNLRQIVIVVTVFLSTLPATQAAEFRPNLTVLTDEIVYNVDADGTFTMDEVETIRINTDQAVKARSQLPLSYSATLQDLEVLEAYTTTKDGRRIDVARDKILLQQSAQSQGAPMFDDGKVKTVVFPAVEIGATLSVHVRKTQKKALFPGQFSMLEVAWADNEFKSERITVRAPASLRLYVDAIDMPGGRIESDQPGTQLWRWSIANVAARAPELGSVGLTDHSPRVAVTTFPSFGTAGAAYLERALPRSVVTPAIQKLADDITKGVSDRRAQAEALYRWVSANIRYVAIFLDFGGVVPHDAQAIADAKYGDCKDHTTLLEALLAAKGIRSSPVLVNAADGYWLPEAAIFPGVFNHAISYVPEFKLYLDSTAGVASFGTLPIGERGKPALVADDGSGKPVLVTLPLSLPESDRVSVNTRLAIDAEGNVKGGSEIASTGAFDWIARQIFVSLPPGVESQVAGRMLTLTGQSGTGDYKHSDARDLATPFVYSTEFRLPGYAQFPGPGAMAVPPGLSGFGNIATAFELFGPEKRELPLPFAGRQIDETVSISLPDGVRVATLPKPVKVTTPFGSYASSYSADGRAIVVKRSLDIRMGGPLVQPDEYAALRALAQTVNRDLRTQLVY